MGVWETCSEAVTMKEGEEKDEGTSDRAFVASEIELNVTGFESNYDINRSI